MYPTPLNEYGIFACSIRLTPEEFRVLLNGPVKNAQAALNEELSKVLYLSNTEE